MGVISRYRAIPILYRMLGAFIIGAVVGIICWYAEASHGVALKGSLDTWLSPLGLVLVKMLKMIVVPLIFFSLLQGAASLPLKKFGRIGVRVIVLYLITSLLAAVIGTVFALAINPGKEGMSLSTVAAGTESAPLNVNTGAASLSAVFMSMFENPFKALADGNFLAVIVFAILAGLALRVLIDDTAESEAAPLNRLLELAATFNRILFVLVEWIMDYAPIGILALTIVNFTQHGPALAGPYFNIAVGIIIGIGLMIGVVYSSMIALLTRSNPLKFFKFAQEAMITAFVTRSSGATLPITLKTAITDLKIRRELADFALPLGATVNMDGVCIHLPMFAILAANIFGVELGFSALLVLVLTTVLAAVGAGGIPGGSLMLLFIILNSMGLNEVQISQIVAFALGINPILDMFETMNNVAGDLTCTYIVACTEGMISQES
ncbi:MAG TPA: dicarboxylate/amino acid:cation symporter [Candidatus Riflebacteria bacterium]|nr:dicarboxylate/amino acid:cation symporter [Candidatus Riflebacteria bacterium]